MLKKTTNIHNCFKKLLSTLSSERVQNTSVLGINGSEHRKKSKPLDVDNFKLRNTFTIKELFDARVHLGHKISSINDHMRPYIYGSRLGHLIFDLNQTAEHLYRALNFSAHIAYNKGIILFISRNPSVTLLVEKTALECNEYAVTRQWRLGSFTDSTNIFRGPVRLPDLCIFLNTLEENGNNHPAIVESARMCIPTVAIVDSNCDPTLITYPVPGNDDTPETINLYCNLFKKAILAGKEAMVKTDNSLI